MNPIDKNKIDTALTKAEEGLWLVRDFQKAWINLHDDALPKSGKKTFMILTVITWALYALCPIDLIPDIIAPLLGPLFFIVLIDDALLVPILGVKIFNKWADKKRRQIESM